MKFQDKYAKRHLQRSKKQNKIALSIFLAIHFKLSSAPCPIGYVKFLYNIENSV